MTRYYFEMDGFEVGEFFHQGNMTEWESLNLKRDFANSRGISMYGIKIRKGRKK